MKKLLLLFLFAVVTALSTKAQIGGGYDSAFNFGGAGSNVKALTKTANGDTYFVVNIRGRAFFAGQQIDGGNYYGTPGEKYIFGKISSTGTQTILRNIDNGGSAFAINQNGELYFIKTGSTYLVSDFGNGITNNNWGTYLVKLNNAGLGQFIKKIDTGSNVEYGNSNIAIAGIQGMQFTPDGNLFITIDANNATTAVAPGYVFPHRIAKYDSDGNEVWHNDFFSKGLAAFSIPSQFVSNDGRVSFAISGTTNQFYFDGEEISSKMSNYVNQAYSVVISLKPDGTKNFFIPAAAGLTVLTGVNPTTGDLYIGYTNGNVGVKPISTPYTSLPNQYPVNLNGYYLFNGTLTFSNAGVYQSYNTLTFDKLFAKPNGFITYQGISTVVDKGGDYVFSTNTTEGVVSYYDANFNFLKAFKTPKLAFLSESFGKTLMGGDFKGNLTFGSTTLIQSFNDTDFQTRFPSYASVKADIFIAQADVNNITPPPTNNWLGVDNNWNNTANWSTGVVPDATTLVKFDNATANMPTTGTTPTALRVTIDAGVTAQLPTDLIISYKLIINGTLQINHTGTLAFKNYGSLGLEGSGNLIFNGTAPSSVSSLATLTGSNNISLSTNENISNLVGIFKNITFIGTAAIISGFLELTDKSESAILNYSSTNYINGQLTRAVNANGIYFFPLKANLASYEPTSIKLNGLTGVNKITVINKAAADNPNLKILNGTTTRHLGHDDSNSDTYWNITSDAAPTAGTFDVTFQKSVFYNGVTDPDKYVVLNRPDYKSPWAYNGTKLASTQTTGNGTVNNGVVSNETATAGVSGLTQFGEYTIAINTTPVPTNTAVITSTWTGSASTEWANAGNWSTNKIPDALTNVVIPAGLTNYPLIYTLNDNARSMVVDAGVTGFKLSYSLALTNGLINNGTVEIKNLINPINYIFQGYKGDVNGTGKLIFKNNSATGFFGIYGGTFNNDIDVDCGDANSFNIVGNFGNNINIISGFVTATQYGSNYLVQTNPNSTIQTTSKVNAIAAETFARAVNTSGTYNFPLQDFQYQRDGIKKFGEIDITNNNISVANVYTVKFESYFNTQVSFANGSDVYNSYINSGQWVVAPSIFATSGSVDITLKTSDYTNGRANINDYVLLRNSTTTSTWEVINGATITQNNGLITVTANGLAPFTANTAFCIGIKAGTTTWLGLTNNWSTGTNWSNGVPGPTVKAIIANALQYPDPTTIPASTSTIPKAAAIEITSGSTLTLPSSFYTPIGIINNGTIKISGTPSSTFYGFGSGSTYANITGTGTLVFDANSPTTLSSTYTGSTTKPFTNNVEVNNPSGLTLTGTTTFAGNITLTNGIVTVPNNTYFTMSNPNATITGTSTAYIKGNLRRTVNPTGTVNFPVGNTINSLSTYAPVSINLNALVNTTVITANFSSAAISGNPALTISGQTVNTLLTSGSWFIDPNTQPSAGSYAVSLSVPKGSSTANNYYVLKRDYNFSSYAWQNLGTNVTSTTIAGIVTASVTGLTSFSQFGIGEGFGTLPVKIIKFTASADAKTAKLYWETASELNNDKFEIERSTNGTDFLNIGEIKGNGTSQKLNTYSFKDYAPVNGVNYYRLKQLDFDGKFEYSEIKFVNFDFKETTFSVYPNPVSDVINFSEAVKSVEIYNLIGAKVFQQTTTATSVKIPTEINNGVYIVKATLLDGSSVSKKIIIRK